MTATEVELLPAPTPDLEQAKADLAATGVARVPEVLDRETLDRVRRALYAAAAKDREDGRATGGFALDLDAGNQRVWNLLNRDPVFAALAAHPVALELVRSVIGWPALLSNISGNITGPGAAAGVLHADQVFVPEPWPECPQGINVAWCIDDFTASNGATEVVPGSHLRHRSPTPADDRVPTIALTDPSGSILAFDSRVWHRAGPNTSTDQFRAAVFPFYTTPIYRPQENWFLSLRSDVLESLSETMLTLLAYKSEGFGLVYGRSPR